MINKSLSFLFLFLFITSFLLAQDWRSPIDFPIKLSGTFCELRTNHFHHGIDIKSSRGVIGDKIYAIGDGIIHRLRVQAAGYGNSIYIRHPEGYVSVYAHLASIDPTLDSIVLAHQYDRETFEIDLHLDSMNIRVNKGDVIGRMGSTGYSFGPHLHFEIRDAKTEVSINPLFFGFEVADNIPPNLSQIRFDYLRKDGSVYGQKQYNAIQGKKTTRLGVDTVRIGAWRCGIALRTQDKMNATHNRNGLYEVRIEVDSVPVYHFRADSAHFHESRAVNILKDVASYKRASERWYLAYDMPGSPLQDYLLAEKSLGWIRPFENKPQLVSVRVADFYSNVRTVQFYLVRDKKMAEQPTQKFNYLLPFHEPNIVRLKSAELSCPSQAFYRDQKLMIEEAEEKSDRYLSPVVKFDGEVVPFYRPCTLRFTTEQLDSAALARAVIVRCSGDDMHHVGCEKTHEGIQTSIGGWGEYVLYHDDKVPSFEVVFCPSVARKRDVLKFKIWDEFESKGKAKEVYCRAEIDGQFILARHDVKSNTFAVPLNNLPAGTFTLSLTYGDAAGNENTWSRKIEIKP